MTIDELCNPDVVTASAADTVHEAAVRMREHHVGTLVVVDEGRRPVALLTDRDLVVCVLAPAPDRVHQLLVGDVVEDGVYTCEGEEPVRLVAQRMRHHGIRRMPVVDAEGVLAGIVSLDDMLALLADELSDLAGAIRSQRLREAHRRP